MGSKCPILQKHTHSQQMEERFKLLQNIKNETYLQHKYNTFSNYRSKFPFSNVETSKMYFDSSQWDTFLCKNDINILHKYVHYTANNNT
jgi:hypothetical protein